MAKQRRIDLVEQILKDMNGSARLQDVLDRLREVERNPDVTYTSLYLAIQIENDKVKQLGRPAKFLTSKDGAPRGTVQLRGFGEKADDATVQQFVGHIEEFNRKIHRSLHRWLISKEWREFESSFLKQVLEGLGFQEVEITPAIKDGGIDARVSYRRGIVKASAIVSAKKWGPDSTIGVSHIREMRGIIDPADTGIIITTGKFSSDAKDDASITGQNSRAIYLIDGEMLVKTCMKLGIGVKAIDLPDLIVLDEEVVGSAAQFLRNDDKSKSEKQISDIHKSNREIALKGMQKITKKMIGNPVGGLTVGEVADPTGYAEGTVRTYLSDGKREALADKIRNDPKARARALKIVTERRLMR
jgi:hypothetical protein